MDNWRILRALDSVRNLVDDLNEFTEPEILYALQLECDTRRRSTVIDRLIAKAADLHRQNYVVKLKEKYHGSFPERCPQQE